MDCCLSQNCWKETILTEGSSWGRSRRRNIWSQSLDGIPLTVNRSGGSESRKTTPVRRSQAVGTEETAMTLKVKCSTLWLRIPYWDRDVARYYTWWRTLCELMGLVVWKHADGTRCNETDRGRKERWTAFRRRGYRSVQDLKPRPNVAAYSGADSRRVACPAWPIATTNCQANWGCTSDSGKSGPLQLAAVQLTDMFRERFGDRDARLTALHEPQAKQVARWQWGSAVSVLQQCFFSLCFWRRILSSQTLGLQVLPPRWQTFKHWWSFTFVIFSFFDFCELFMFFSFSGRSGRDGKVSSTQTRAVALHRANGGHFLRKVQWQRRVLQCAAGAESAMSCGLGNVDWSGFALVMLVFLVCCGRTLSSRDLGYRVDHRAGLTNVLTDFDVELPDAPDEDFLNTNKTYPTMTTENINRVFTQVMWYVADQDGLWVTDMVLWQYPSTGNFSSCFFIWRGLISLCSYSFWRRSNFFFLAVEGLQFLTRPEIFFFDFQFSCFVLCHVCICIRNGTFNHCGRSKAWNSTHHGRYVFQTWFFHEKWAKSDTDMCMNTDMYIYTYRYMYMCVYACVFVFFVVWCRVMSCVARRCWLGALCPCVVVPLIASS